VRHPVMGASRRSGVVIRAMPRVSDRRRCAPAEAVGGCGRCPVKPRTTVPTSR
jgi:hypothetical protein